MMMDILIPREERLIIAIAGKKRSGKDLLARLLESDIRVSFGPKLQEGFSSPKYRVSQIYYFAEGIKRILHEVFGVHRRLLWGTDEEKNQLSQLKWENLPWQRTVEYPSNPVHLTGRECMQELGEAMRVFDEHCWSRSLVRAIDNSRFTISFIADMRREEEILYLRDHFPHCCTIRLHRQLLEDTDTHVSEKELDHLDPQLFDIVLHNDATPEKLLASAREAIYTWMCQHSRKIVPQAWFELKDNNYAV